MSHGHVWHVWLNRQVRCNVMQCVAECCSMLQCVAVCCSMLPCHTDMSHRHVTSSLLSKYEDMSDTSEEVMTQSDVVNWVITLQHTATHCNTLQHTATHCNTLQHTVTGFVTECTTYNIWLSQICLPHHFFMSSHEETHHLFVSSLLKTWWVRQIWLSQMLYVVHSVTNPVTVCCSVLQCVAVCCSVLQCVAVCWHRDMNTWWVRHICVISSVRCVYGVAMVSRIDTITGHFCRISSLL